MPRGSSNPPRPRSVSFRCEQGVEGEAPRVHNPLTPEEANAVSATLAGVLRHGDGALNSAVGKTKIGAGASPELPACVSEKESKSRPQSAPGTIAHKLHAKAGLPPRQTRPQTAKIVLTREYPTRDWIPKSLPFPAFATPPRAAPPNTFKQRDVVEQKLKDTVSDEPADTSFIMPRDIFTKYDSSKSGTMNVQELAYMLEDAGLLKSMDIDAAGVFVEDTFRQADADKDGSISYHEFEALVKNIHKSNKKLNLIDGLQKKLLSPEMLNHKGLQEIFRSFAVFGKGASVDNNDKLRMSGTQWAKLCRECNLIDPMKLNSRAADIIFTRVKNKFSRDIGYLGFLDAISLVAAKKEVSVGEVALGILTGGTAKDPRTLTVEMQQDTTLPKDLQRIFDVYDRDGSGSIDKAEAAYMMVDMGILEGVSNNDAGMILEREYRRIDVDNDGSISQAEFWRFWKNLNAHLKKKVDARVQTRAGPAARGSLAGVSPSPGSDEFVEGEARADQDEDPKNIELFKRCKHVFLKFCEWRGHTAVDKNDPSLEGLQEVHKELMDRARWMKLCKDCRLIDKERVTKTGAEIIFSRIRHPGEFRIGFQEFWDGLRRISLDRNESLADTARLVVHTERPRVAVAAASPSQQQIALINREREKRCRQVFKQYDTNNDNSLDKREMTYVLQDMGVLDDMKADEASAMIDAEFAKMDKNHTGRITVNHFSIFFHRMSADARNNVKKAGQRRDQSMEPPRHYKLSSSLQKVFCLFCKYKPLRDATTPLETQRRASVTFTSDEAFAAPQSSSTARLSGRSRMLSTLSSNSFGPAPRPTPLHKLHGVRPQSVRVRSPTIHGSVASQDSVRRVQSGPNEQMNKFSPLNHQGSDYNDAPDGLKTPTSQQFSSGRHSYSEDKSCKSSTLSPRTRPATASSVGTKTDSSNAQSAAHTNSPPQQQGPSRAASVAVAGGEKFDVDNHFMTCVQWQKLNYDAQLMVQGVCKGSLEVIFARVKPQGARHMRYNDFLLGLAHVAKDIDMTYDEVVAHVIKTRHPHPSHRDVTFGATRPNGGVRERTLEEFEGAMEAWGQEHAQHIVFVQDAKMERVEKAKMSQTVMRRIQVRESVHHRKGQREYLEHLSATWEHPQMHRVMSAVRRGQVPSRV